jgi:hypothetical protein
MPIIQSTTVFPSDFIATNVPVDGQVPSKNADGTFTWVENSGAVAQTELTEYIINKQTRGFTDLSKFTLTLTGAEKDTLTLTDLGAGYDFYLNGTLYHETGNRVLAITGGAGNAHTAGLWYFYSDSADLTLKVKINPFNFTGNEILVAAVEWNGDLPSGSRSLLSLESHTSLIDARVHSYLHFTHGYQLVPGGGEVSGYNLNSGLKVDKQFSIASARCYDEDLIHVLDELVGGDGKYCTYYRTGTGVWGWTFNENYPFKIATSPSARVLYDDGTITGAEASSISYMNIYEILTNIEGQARHIFVSSQQTYLTLEEAYSASFSDLDLTGFPVSERIVSHKITIEVNDDTVGDGHCYYERVANYGVSAFDLSASTIGAPGVVEGSTIDNFVSFSSTRGGQKDSGKNATSFVEVAGDTMTGKLITVASAAVAGAGFNIPQGVVGNTLVEGDLWSDSTKKSLNAFSGGIRQSLVGNIFSKIATVTLTGSVSTAETSYISVSDIGTLTLPSKFLSIGKTLRIKFAGIFSSSTSSATLVPIRVKLGTVIVAQNATVDPANSLTNQGFFGEVVITCRTIGATGTVFSQGYTTRASSTTAFTTDPILSTTAVTVDTTIENVLDVFGQYIQNTSGNSISMTNLTVEVL